ncbi:MAG: hypothetical protein FGF53_10735, partial [Candidatus Brockarchaeota archaeon]|nr:hypothetical protein [Candidatus Brockarchaeota archaeon]
FRENHLLKMSVFRKLKEKVTPPKANVSVTLKKLLFILGDAVEGIVQVESQEEFDCTEIRCELECVEKVRRVRRIYNEALKREVDQQVWESAVLFSAKPQLIGAMHIPEGFIQNFQFKIPVPLGAQPSFKSLDRVVTWSLKGVVAVDGRPDANSRTIEIQVAHPSQAPKALSLTVSCKYCGTVFPEGESKCPNCGAPRTV